MCVFEMYALAHALYGIHIYSAMSIALLCECSTVASYMHDKEFELSLLAVEE